MSTSISTTKKRASDREGFIHLSDPTEHVADCCRGVRVVEPLQVAERFSTGHAVEHHNFLSVVHPVLHELARASRGDGGRSEGRALAQDVVRVTCDGPRVGGRSIHQVRVAPCVQVTA